MNPDEPAFSEARPKRRGHEVDGDRVGVPLRLGHDEQPIEEL